METIEKDPCVAIQDYIRAKWRRPGVALSADELGRRLDPALRDRVDLLGIDDQKLLGVRPEHVLRRIEELEREALREDSRIGAHKKAFVTSTKQSKRPPQRRAARSRR